MRVVQQVNIISFQPSMSPITFTDEDFKGFDPSQDDPMVITVDINNFFIMKTLVDQGSSVGHPLLEDVQEDEDRRRGDKVVQ